VSNTSITNVEITDTFQVWLNKTNQIIDLANENIMLAGPGAGFTITGNSTLNGSFTANVLTSTSGRIDNLSIINLSRAVDSDETIISESPIRINSNIENIFTLKTSSGNRAIFRLINGGNASWEIGQSTSAGASPIIIRTTGASTPQAILTQAGRFTVNELEGNGSLITNLSLTAIPDLPASKTTSGTFNTARIPNLNASKITTGVLGDARIPDLNTSKITDGIFSIARLPISTKQQAETGTNNTSVMTPLRTKESIAALSFPSGGIIMWSGSITSIPQGWALCNGSSGTPDLRDRFIVGAGSTYGVGATGGADSVTLTEAQMPAHTHTFSGSTNTTGAHSHPITGDIFSGNGTFTGMTARTTGGNYFTVNNTTLSAGDHSHTFSGTTASTGGGSSHENRPPYYALAFIMKL
jgi:microcystin-dependent protein